MNLKKFIQTIALVLCFSFLNSVISIAASDTSVMSRNELSIQNVSGNSVSEQAKKKGEDYYISFFFVFIHSEPSLFSSAGILVYGQKVTVLSDSGFYTYVRTEDGRKGYIFTVFLSKNLFRTESKLISVDFANVYLGDTKSKLITAVNGSGSVSWTVIPNDIIDFDEKTGDVTGLKCGTATITAYSGFKSDTCVVHCIYEWEKSWVGKAKTSTTVKIGPGDSYDSLITMKPEHKFTVYGDGGTAENDADSWAYGKYTINGNNYYGYVKINDISSKGTVSQYNNMKTKINDGLAEKYINWIWPIKDNSIKNISSPYAPRGDSTSTTVHHRGMDITTGVPGEIAGEPVVSACTGVVKSLRLNIDSCGYCISISSDCTDSVTGEKIAIIYMHLQSSPKYSNGTAIKRGDKISAGTVIGKVGNTNNGTSPGMGYHLHFEVNNKNAGVGDSGRSNFVNTINPIYFYINTQKNATFSKTDSYNNYGGYWYAKAS